MRATVEPVEGNKAKVKLSVTLDEEEFEKALDATYRKLARQVRVPGFRPGKAPRRVLEARMGAEQLRVEALEESLPDFYAQAVRDTDLEPIASPEIDITGGRQSGPVSFDALVEVRPSVNIAGYTGLQVTVPPLLPTEDEIDSQVDRLREQFGELKGISRPARDGDHVTVDVKAYRHQETVKDLTRVDYLYEVGSGTLVPGLDEQLRGSNVGDIFKFNARVDHPGAQDATTGDELSFQVLVKDVKEKILPEPTDEWASEASEFSTLEELRQDISSKLASLERIQASLAVREQTLVALSDLVGEDVPEALINDDLQQRLQRLSHRLDSQGITLERYVEAVGRDELIAQLRQDAARSVRIDLALRALADAEGIEVSDEDLDEELGRLAEQADVGKAKLRSELERAGRLSEVRSEVRNSQALTWLLDHVGLVDEEGNSVDRAVLEPPENPESPENTENPETVTVESEV